MAKWDFPLHKPQANPSRCSNMTIHLGEALFKNIAHVFFGVFKVMFYGFDPMVNHHDKPPFFQTPSQQIQEFRCSSCS